MRALFFLLTFIGLHSVIATADDFQADSAVVLGDCNPACQWFIRDSEDAKVETWEKKGNRITQYQYDLWKEKRHLVCDGECDGSGPCTHTRYPGTVENEDGQEVRTTWHVCACKHEE